MTPEYKLKGSEIFRTEDNKLVANVVDSVVIPTAPVYYKEGTIEKIRAAYTSSEAPESIEAPEPESEPIKEEPAPVALQTFKEVTIPHDHPQIEVAGKELEELFKSMEGMKPRQVWDAIGRAALGMTLPTDKEEDIHLPTGGPEIDPALGNRTPGFPTWLHEVNPDEAAKRFASGYCDEYNDLMKNLKPTE